MGTEDWDNHFNYANVNSFIRKHNIENLGNINDNYMQIVALPRDEKFIFLTTRSQKYKHDPQLKYTRTGQYTYDPKNKNDKPPQKLSQKELDDLVAKHLKIEIPKDFEYTTQEESKSEKSKKSEAEEGDGGDEEKDEDEEEGDGGDEEDEEEDEEDTDEFDDDFVDFYKKLAKFTFLSKKIDDFKKNNNIKNYDNIINLSKKIKINHLTNSIITSFKPQLIASKILAPSVEEAYLNGFIGNQLGMKTPYEDEIQAANANDSDEKTSEKVKAEIKKKGQAYQETQRKVKNL